MYPPPPVWILLQKQDRVHQKGKGNQSWETPSPEAQAHRSCLRLRLGLNNRESLCPHQKTKRSQVTSYSVCLKLGERCGERERESPLVAQAFRESWKPSVEQKHLWGLWWGGILWYSNPHPNQKRIPEETATCGTLMISKANTKFKFDSTPDSIESVPHTNGLKEWVLASKYKCYLLEFLLFCTWCPACNK